MNGETRLVDTNVLVHAYTVSDDRKHAVALSMLERIWEGEGATTTLQNLCECFFVVTRKVARPISASAAEDVARGILGASQWRVVDRRPETVLKAMELVRLHRGKLWDALIAPCMLEHGVHTIVTENERDFKRIPDITVITGLPARRDTTFGPCFSEPPARRSMRSPPSFLGLYDGINDGCRRLEVDGKGKNR